MIDLKKLFQTILFTCLLGLPFSSFAAVPDHFVIQTIPSATVGDFVPVTITAFTSGPAMTDYYGTVTLTASSATGTITPTVTGNFILTTSSQWIGNVQLTAAGAITITCTGEGGATGNTVIALSAKPAVQLIPILTGRTHTPGLAPGATPDTIVNLYEGMYHPITIYAVDEYFNIDPSFTGTITSFANGGDFRPSASEAAVSGVAWMEGKFDEIGLVTLDLTAGGSLSNTGVANSLRYLNIQSASTGYLFFKVPSQEVVAGEPFGVTLTVSASSSDPDQTITSNSDSFRIDRFLSGTSTPAGGTWGPSETINMVNGIWYQSNFTYSRAEDIYLRGAKTGSGGIAIIANESNVIDLVPNAPATVSVTVSPNEIQSNRQAVITANVFDIYGNATNSTRYPFSVRFAKQNTAQGGTLSLASSPTNLNGEVSSTFTAGAINEDVPVVVDIFSTTSNAVVASQVVTVKVSVASTEPGSIVNYPNPFNPAQNQTTSINYYLTSDSDIELYIYDAFGRIVVSEKISKDDLDAISQSATSSGGASWTWDGKNGEGRVVANGIYYVRVLAKTPGNTQEYKRRVGVLK